MEQKKDTEMSKPTENSKGTKKNSVNVWILVLCGVLLGAVIALGAVLFMKKDTAEETRAVANVSSGRGVLVTPENVHELIEQDQKNTDASYTLSMNFDWQFEDGASPSSNAYVENSQLNSRTVYFDLFLGDTEELIYSSPYIPLGGELTGFALDKDLDAGVYEATMVYHLVDDEYQEITTVTVGVNLYISN